MQISYVYSIFFHFVLFSSVRVLCIVFIINRFQEFNTVLSTVLQYSKYLRIKLTILDDINV